MNTEEVMRERAMLIGWKFSHGLTAEETARLDWLNAEALRLCPTVTPEMTAALEAIRTRLDSRQARRKTPNAKVQADAACGGSPGTDSWADREDEDMTTETKLDTKRVPHPGYRFWLFDPEGDGMTYYRTAEDRDKAAAVAIDTCRGDGDEGWYEDGLEGIAAGEVTHVARVTDKKMRPDDLDDEQCDGEGTYWGDFEWMGNYTMVPLPNASNQGQP